MNKSSFALNAWNKMAGVPGGKRMFSRMVCFKAPYFASIHPLVEGLQRGHCAVTIRKRRCVQNHIGTVHAIAMCNMAEIAGGLATDASVPSSHRWIPKGMSVEYLAKATTDLRAVATLDPIPQFGEAGEHIVPVVVTDAQDQTVFRAAITMWVSPKSRQHESD